MKNEDEEIQKEVIDTIAATVGYGIAAIPVVGGALSTIYFDVKGKIRFKRIEKFYKELAIEVEKIQDQISDIDNFDQEAVAVIIEEINEKIEKEYDEKKIEFIKNYFKNTLINPIDKNNFDERRFLLNTLSKMSLLECDIMTFLKEKKSQTKVENIKLGEIDQNIIIGAIDRLKNYGFLNSIRKVTSYGKDERLGVMVKLNEFGEKFIMFCLEDI